MYEQHPHRLCEVLLSCLEEQTVLFEHCSFLQTKPPSLLDKSTSHEKYRAPSLGDISHPKVFSTLTGETATWNRLPLTSISNDVTFQMSKSTVVHFNYEVCITERD